MFRVLRSKSIRTVAALSLLTLAGRPRVGRCDDQTHPKSTLSDATRAALEAGSEWLLRTQHADGSFAEGESVGPEAVTQTAVCAVALRVASSKFVGLRSKRLQAATERAMAWMLSADASRTAWREELSVNSALSYAALAANAVRGAQAKRLLDSIVGQQDVETAWWLGSRALRQNPGGDGPSVPDANLICSWWAAWALTEGSRFGFAPNWDSLLKNARSMCERQQADGTWTTDPEFEAQRKYKETHHAWRAATTGTARATVGLAELSAVRALLDTFGRLPNEVRSLVDKSIARAMPAFVVEAQGLLTRVPTYSPDWGLTPDVFTDMLITGAAVRALDVAWARDWRRHAVARVILLQRADGGWGTRQQLSDFIETALAVLFLSEALAGM
jgi:hypothetical protein